MGLTRDVCVHSSVLCIHGTVVTTRFRRSKDECLRDLHSGRRMHVDLLRTRVRLIRRRRGVLSVHGRTCSRRRDHQASLGGTVKRLTTRLDT